MQRLVMRPLMPPGAEFAWTKCPPSSRRTSDDSAISARNAARSLVPSLLTRTTSGGRTPNSTGRRRRNLEHSPDRDAGPAIYHGDTVRVSRNRAVDNQGLRACCARRYGWMGGGREKRG